MKNFETLEIGCSYKNKNGKVVKIESNVNNLTHYPFMGDDRELYMANGTWNRLDSYTNFNLVEKIEVKNFTELEDGCVYENRKGEKVTVKKRSEGDGLWHDRGNYPFSVDNKTFTVGGEQSILGGKSLYDLIRKVGKNFTELEIGATYRMRNGETCKIELTDGSELYPFGADNRIWFTSDGNYYSHPNESEYDIMSKISDPIDEKDARIKELEKIIEQKNEIIEMITAAQEKQTKIIEPLHKLFDIMNETFND